MSRSYTQDSSVTPYPLPSSPSTTVGGSSTQAQHLKTEKYVPTTRPKANVPVPAQSIDSYHSKGKMVEQQQPPYLEAKGPNPAFARTRWALFWTFLMFSLLALLMNIVSLSIQANAMPIPWLALQLPFVPITLNAAFIILILVLDHKYPHTFLSKPVGELIILGFIVAFHTGIAIYVTTDTEFYYRWYNVMAADDPSTKETVRRLFPLTWTLVVCLYIQPLLIFIVWLNLLTRSIHEHKKGNKHVWHHPVCRYDPQAPHSLVYAKFKDAPLLPTDIQHPPMRMLVGVEGDAVREEQVAGGSHVIPRPFEKTIAP